MKWFLSRRRLVALVTLGALAVFAANLSDIRSHLHAFSIRNVPRGQPTAFEIIDSKGTVETHQGQLAAVLVESLFPTWNMACSPWSWRGNDVQTRVGPVVYGCRPLGVVANRHPSPGENLLLGQTRFLEFVRRASTIGQEPGQRRSTV